MVGEGWFCFAVLLFFFFFFFPFSYLLFFFFKTSYTLKKMCKKQSSSDSLIPQYFQEVETVIKASTDQGNTGMLSN